MALPNKWVPITIAEKFVLWKLESMINSEPIIVNNKFSRNENISYIICSKNPLRVKVFILFCANSDKYKWGSKK